MGEKHWAICYFWWHRGLQVFDIDSGTHLSEATHVHVCKNITHLLFFTTASLI